jgi:cytochrome c oxidase accessory protein FixG
MSAQPQATPPLPDLDDFRDHLATVDAQGKRIWMYPKKPKGRFYNARTWVSAGFLLVFLALPFVKIHGDPLFLFNILERRFIVFGFLFTPQDFVLFGLLMLTFLLFIILFTLVYGRLFCGWVCPQTVFMEMVFRKIEYWIEGDYKRQQQLDKAPWTSEKVQKKALKHLAFFAISFVVANYFLAYIIGMDEVLRIVSEPVSQNTSGFGAILLFSGVFYGVFARLREQVCTTICPYGRMQGVLLVKESIVVAYDHVRGEPRGKLKKGERQAADGSPQASSVNPPPSAVSRPPSTVLGDCVDCHLCVAVCPTGIDIRNGTQLECVNCTACMDACDEVMDKIGRPRSLIRYDSMTGIEQRNRRLFTGRAKAYSAVLLALIILDATLLLRRSPIEAIVLRSQGQLYQTLDDAHTANLYTYQMINKTARDLPVRLRVATPGCQLRFVAAPPTVVKRDSLAQGVFFIDAENTALTGRKTRLVIEVYSGDKKIDELKTTFLGPTR